MTSIVSKLATLCFAALVLVHCSSSDEDCAADCFGDCQVTESIGDGTCDTQNYCAELEYDGGDCGKAPDTGTNTGTNGDDTADLPCGGDCGPQNARYTECTCGESDPCGWRNDKYCDDYCTDNFATVFDDSSDCPECGNGGVNGDEECDTMGESATCDDDCTEVSCGDNNLNATAGETCDDGEESATCNADCSLAACGDGVVNAAAGEACDQAELNADDVADACRLDCTLPTCGDGVIDTDEFCDDGSLDACGPCNEDCSAEGSLVPCDDPSLTCGNGIVDENEVCDDGYADACGTCNEDCSNVGTGATCGDGQLCEQFETCDDGSTDACGECNEDCSAAGTLVPCDEPTKDSDG